MTDPMFFILAAVAERPRHGYDVIRRVAEITGGEVQLATGTLYPAIERLLAKGLVQIADQRDADAPDRRYYAVSHEGARQLLAEIAAKERQASWARTMASAGGISAGALAG